MPRRPAPPALRKTPHISASEFKATCLELMDDVARTGIDLIVTKHGRPVVRLSPLGDIGQSPWGFLAGTVVHHGDIVSADEQLWATSPTEPLTKRNRH